MKILTIAIYDLKKILRDKTALIFMIIMPVVFTFLMGIMYGSNSGSTEVKIPIGITNYDDSKLASDLLAEIKKDKTIELKELKEEELREKVKSVEITSGFIIPEGFAKAAADGKLPEIKVVKLPTSADFVATEGIISNAFSRLQIKEGTTEYFKTKLEDVNADARTAILTEIGQKVEDNLQKPPVVSSEIRKFSQGSWIEKYDGKAQSSLGMAVMFVMFTVILSGAGAIFEEKKDNTWGRLCTTPTTNASIISGKILGTFIKGWVQIAFLILFGSLVIGVSWGNSLGATILLMSMYLLSVTAFGLLLASFVKTNAQLGAVSAIIIISTSMISGCYWPIEVMPDFMQKIAMAFPQYWAMKGLSNTVVSNLGLSSVMQSVEILAGMAVLFFLISMLSGKLKLSFDIKPGIKADA